MSKRSRHNSLCPFQQKRNKPVAKARNSKRVSQTALEHMVETLTDRLVEAELQLKALKNGSSTRESGDDTLKVQNEALLTQNKKLISTILRYRRSMLGLKNALDREIDLKATALQASREMEEVLLEIKHSKSISLDSMTTASRASMALAQANASRSVGLHLMLPGIYHG